MLPAPHKKMPNDIKKIPLPIWLFSPHILEPKTPITPPISGIKLNRNEYNKLYIPDV